MIAEMKAADSAWDLWNKTRDRYWLGYSEAIRDAADIERKTKTPEWLSEVLNSEDGTYKP